MGPWCPPWQVDNEPNVFSLAGPVDLRLALMVPVFEAAATDRLKTSRPKPALAPIPSSLEPEGGDEGRAFGLGPEGVVSAFDVPADVFAFDDARVGPVPSGRVEAVGESADRLDPEPVSGVRGENRPAGRSRHE